MRLLREASWPDEDTHVLRRLSNASPYQLRRHCTSNLLDASGQHSTGFEQAQEAQEVSHLKVTFYSSDVTGSLILQWCMLEIV
jgi:hypothetical protein